MFTRINIKFGLIVLLSGLIVWHCQRQKSGQEEMDKTTRLSKVSQSSLKTISIRNETNEFIHYTINPVSSSSYPEDRVLRIGEIDRILAKEDITLTYRQDGKVIRRQLYLGKYYSFTYDEANTLTIQDGWAGLEQGEDLAPFLATPMEIVDLMLEMAKVNKDDMLYDLGCGDGRIVIRAAERYGARGVGIDFNPKRIKESQAGAKKAGVENLVEFRLEDVTKSDFSPATIVTVYLLTRSNERLRPLLEEQLKPGTRVIAHNYRIPGWDHKQTDLQTVRLSDLDTHTIFLYIR